MKRIVLLLMVISFFPLYLAGASVKTVSPSKADDLVKIGRHFMATDYINSFVMFETEVAQRGEYHLFFRIMPACHEDSIFTKYTVYVDSTEVGTITPHTDTWQNLEIDDRKSISIGEGKHIVTISTPYGNPMLVEDMYIVDNNYGDLPSTDKYDSFMNKCLNGEVSFMSEVTANYLSSFNDNGIFRNLPLMYTFHIFLDLKKDDILDILTACPKNHSVDLIYWGYVPIYTMEDLAKEIDALPNGFEPPKDPVETPGFKPATFKEKEGLTFTGVAEYNGSHAVNLYGKYQVMQKIHVPKDGRYFLRIRSAESGSTSTAMISLNSKSINGYWAQVPVSDSYVLQYLPNGVSYNYYTQCSNPDNDCPILFMQMYLGSQIQNYSNKFESNIPDLFDCGKNDVQSIASVNYPIGSISVNSMNSVNPESTYNLCYIVGENVPMMLNLLKASKTNRLIPIEDSSDVFIYNHELIIKNSDQWLDINTYDIKGNHLGQHIILEYEGDLHLALSELGISLNGIYILQITGKKETKTIKVII